VEEFAQVQPETLPPIQPETPPSSDAEFNLPEPAELAAEPAIETDFTDQPETPDEPAADTDAPVEEPAGEVLLTQVADDSELFDDPNLDVVGVAPGEEREIVIPVEMGAAGKTRRFKLSVRLRLDLVD
jgi:hypothetical protein